MACPRHRWRSSSRRASRASRRPRRWLVRGRVLGLGLVNGRRSAAIALVIVVTALTSACVRVRVR
eukprot:scaffold80474_cov21-Phaeocystis_antarctica.AAC.1